ncbi:unnamed protein product [Dovyalis caffra]|uniref:Uncharacterized protein n=1 Tax=Dovyalis caffra TaxID=77055 RepID=A0AAV1QYK4_9ROSI|nr:unnamed protein product [Dovyalis caffra]
MAEKGQNRHREPGFSIARLKCKSMNLGSTSIAYQDFLVHPNRASGLMGSLVKLNIMQDVGRETFQIPFGIGLFPYSPQRHAEENPKRREKKKK